MAQATNDADPIDITAFIDATPLSGFQKWILALIGLTVFIDGFDVQAMGYVAPAIAAEWGIARASLGPLFGAGLFGMLVGSLTISIIADRVGRRPVMLGSILSVGLCALATARAHSMVELEILRFLTGIGLGAIMPNATALANEFSPRAYRVRLMMFVSCGFPLGAVFGGLLSASMIPALGWRSVFYFGGAIPLLLVGLMFFFLPESMQFLVARGKDLSRIASTLRRIDGRLQCSARTRYLIHETRQTAMPVIALFQSARARVTSTLWILQFINLLCLHFLANWLPTIARDAGIPTSQAVLVGTTLQVGGVIGTVLMGPIIDRRGFFRVLIPVFAVAASAIALIGVPGLPLWLLFSFVMLAGFCVVGGQPAVNAMTANFYPTVLRSTGLGWALGVGRVGSIIGPVLGGELMGLHWSNQALFLAVALPLTISVLLLLWLTASFDPERSTLENEHQLFTHGTRAP